MFQSYLSPERFSRSIGSELLSAAGAGMVWRSSGVECRFVTDKIPFLISLPIVHRLSLVSLADHLEGVRRFPKNSQKTK